jgi:tRNA dimethylallyltransferase
MLRGEMGEEAEAVTGGRPADVVLIAGPTASGKSALAMEIAGRTGAVVINADAMQVYRELRVLTARPTVADEAAAPHRLYGHRSAAEAHAVADWLSDLAAVLGEARGEGRPAVVVGGTGLYLTAATLGLSAIPSIPAEIRDRRRADARERGAAALHAELGQRDPESAAYLDPADTQRIVRALEVLDATGRPLRSFQADRQPPVIPASRIAAAFVVAPERADLHRRIEDRFHDMVSAGALEEARALDALGLDPSLPAMKAIGVPEMIAAARGDTTVDSAVAAAVAATRRYAKRQETWFRNQMPDWRRVEPGHFVAAADAVAQLLKRGLDRLPEED